MRQRPTLDEQTLSFLYRRLRIGDDLLIARGPERTQEARVTRIDPDGTVYVQKWRPRLACWTKKVKLSPGEIIGVRDQ